MAAWLILLATFLVCIYVYLWVTSRRARRMLAGASSSLELPFIGNAYQISPNTEYLMDFILGILKKMEVKGLPYVFWMGPYPLLFLTDPEDLKVVNNASVEKPHFYKLAGEFVGDGLITADATKWKQNIKKLGNVFNNSVVDGYQELFSELCQTLVIKLRKEGVRDYHTIKEHVAMTGLQAICQTTMGIPSHMLDEVIGPDYLKRMHRAMGMLMGRAANIFYHVDAIYHRTAHYRELMQHRDFLHSVCAKMIERKREARRSGQETAATRASNRYKPFIDVLLDMQEADPSLTDEYLKNEMLTFVVAGHDTVAVNVTCSLLLLGSHPEVQRKMRDEVRKVLDSPKKLLDKPDLDRLTYSDAVVTEALRLYPPVPVFLRATEQDVSIKSFTIPSGTIVAGLIYGSNRLQSIWGPDANEFRPERWLQHDCPDNSFIPFSIGRRTCVGKRYALPLVKTMVAYMVRDLDFESDISKMSLKLEISIKPLHCTLTYREVDEPFESGTQLKKGMLFENGALIKNGTPNGKAVLNGKARLRNIDN